MLVQRILTAIALLALLLPAIFLAPAWVWGGLSLLFLAAAAHEWARLLPAGQGTAARRGRRAMPFLVVLGGTGLLVLREWHGWPAPVLVVAMLGLSSWWVIAGSLPLRRRDAASAGGALTVGLLLLGCWVALHELRVMGPFALLSSMAVVWVADIAAYFAGRAFGRRKLAPTISPGKTWEGAVAAVVVVVAAGLASAALAGESGVAMHLLPAVLVAWLGAPWAGLAFVALVALSIVGDLHESLLKRQAGVKDSGRLLPGHGGVLDRIDALIPTMPVVLLLHLLST